jgi:hypothetical protein
VTWILILLATAVVMAGVLAIVAVIAAGASERVREGADVAQSALWAAGFKENEQHVLATLATLARGELDAGSVEIVIAPPGWSGDGIVVTGSRIASARLGVRVPVGSGIVGRALETGRTALSEPRVAMAVPIRGGAGLIGVVLATSPAPDRLYGALELERLEALVAQTARQLRGPVSRSA